MKITALALVALPLVAGAASAAEPVALTTTVGDVSVVSYTLPSGDDLRVVSTARIGEASDAPVFRVTSLLKPNSEVVISVPQAAGEAPLEVRLVRDGDTVRQDTAGF